MKANYHTHTTRCQHAQGLEDTYVLHAIGAGFELLGFSDHTPWPFENGYVSRIRMPDYALQGYMDTVLGLRDRYSGQIDIRLGLEAEYFPCYRDYLLRMRDGGIQYYVLGQHCIGNEIGSSYSSRECETDDGVRRYAESVVEGMRTGLYLYLAHPDLMMSRRRDEDFNAACMEAADMICQAANEMHMPLEYNLLGLSDQLNGHERGYPSRAFWEYVKKWDNAVILGVDAHAPAALSDIALWHAGQSKVKALGLRLLDDLEHPW